MMIYEDFATLPLVESMDVRCTLGLRPAYIHGQDSPKQEVQP
jgi:hypothetical protein